ncbi:unnamed protein product [Staurois parvus]|uniref:Uncharacterized protein n=1 Tax=Staurois parvus TaxID=386267 RepID=A0ABN9CAQ7_9NEOB|nr:unnamed protein product [Staurois parvus]
MRGPGESGYIAKCRVRGEQDIVNAGSGEADKHMKCGGPGESGYIVNAGSGR